MKAKKKSRRPLEASNKAHDQAIADIYNGQRLDDLLAKIWRSIELAKSSKGELPDKIWIKQQFAIGVNDVTRLLERMPQGDTVLDAHEISCPGKSMRRSSSVSLQAVLVAADCNPKWLTKHIPILASSKMVPVILVKDGKCASLRLGALLNLKTALAVGVKARGSCINAAFEEFL